MIRTLLSPLLLLALVWWLDAGELAKRMAGLRPGWVLLAVAISVPQILLSALRWRLTAGRLGIDLPFPRALREYYLAAFLNQVLPGGVVGERLSGQAVMAGTALVSVAALPLFFGAGGRALLPLVMGGLAALALAVGLAGRLRADDGPLSWVWRDVHAALLAPGARGPQLLTSTLVVGSYLATYLVAARAVGVEEVRLVFGRIASALSAGTASPKAR